MTASGMAVAVNALPTMVMPIHPCRQASSAQIPAMTHPERHTTGRASIELVGWHGDNVTTPRPSPPRDPPPCAT